MGVRTIGFQFTGDYRDLDAALDRMDARIRQSVASANNASGAAGTAATRTSAAIRAGSDAAVRSGAHVVQAEQRSTAAVQAHTTAQEAATRAALAAAAAEERAARAEDAARSHVGDGESAANAQRLAAAERSAAQRAAAELSVAEAAERAATREVEAAQSAARREVAAQERAVRSMALIEAAAHRENERRERATQAEAEQAASQRAEAASDIGEKLLAVGAATAAGVGIAVKSFADFDAAMSGAQAGTQATGAALDALRGSAIKAGAESSFSATEAAQGITELGKAGVSVEDILSGGLTGALNLAAAGQLAVADAAEISASALTQFQLRGEDLTHVADLLAAGANAAQGSVADIGLALSYVGPVAHSAGISIEDTVGSIAQLSAAGITGEKAGTALRGMFISMTAPTVTAQEALDTYGIELRDANGNFIGTAAAAQELHDKLDGVGKAQQDAALKTIFGTEQLAAATIVVNGGARANLQWADAVNQQGAAAQTAGVLTNNLRGDVERLGGSLSTVFIQSGSGANDFLRGFTTDTQKAVDAFGRLPVPLQQGALGLAALTAAATLTGGAMLILLPKIAATKVALIELTGSAAATQAAMLRLGKLAGIAGLAIAAVEFDKYINRSHVATVSTDRLAESMLGFGKTGELGGAALEILGSHIGPFQKDAKTSAEALDRLAQSADNAFGTGFDDKIYRVTKFGSAGKEFSDQAKQIDQSLAQLVANGNADQATAAFDRMTKRLGEQGVPLDKVKEKFPQYAAALDASAAASASAAAGGKAVAKGVAEAGQAAEDAKQAVDDLIEALVDAGVVVLDARAAARQYEDALDAVAKAVKKGGDATDIEKKKNREAQEQLDAFAQAALDKAEAVFEATGSEEKFAKSLQASRKVLVDAARDLGYSKKAADKYADSILRIPAAASTKIGLVGTKAAIEHLEEVRARLKALKDKKIRITVFNPTPAQLAAVNAERGYADGGQVAGQGGPRQDNILAAVSAREFIHPVRAVDHYGLPFMEAVRTLRLPRFADGGQVGAASSINTAAASSTRAGVGQLAAPQVIRVPVHESHTRTVQVGDVHLPAANPSEFEDWAHDQGRRAEKSYS